MAKDSRAAAGQGDESGDRVVQARTRAPGVARMASARGDRAERQCNEDVAGCFFGEGIGDTGPVIVRLLALYTDRVRYAAEPAVA